jgi:hypothetical protein
VPVPFRDVRQRLILLGVSGAVLMLAGVGLLRIFTVRPFVPADEPANVDYAMQITYGHLPVAGTRIHHLFPGQRSAFQHTSNHPPLYHAIVGPILRLGLHVHHPNVAVLAARLVALGAAIGAVLLIAVLARNLIGPIGGPRTAQVVVAAAGLLACLPTFVSASAIVQNDTLATALILAALIPMVQIVRHGSSPGRVAWLAGCSAAAVLTRVTSAPACLIAAAAVGLAGWLWPAAGQTCDPRRRMLTAVQPIAITVAAIAAAAGWFIVLNVHRYGDWTGGSAVDAVVHSRHEPGSNSVLSYLLEPRSWLVQFTQVTGGLDTEVSPQPQWAVPLAVLLMAVLAAGIIAFVVRWRRQSIRVDHQQVLCLAALGLSLAATMGEIAVHAADGGGVHGRYLLPAAAALCVGGAALLCLPRRIGVAIMAIVLGIELYGGLRSHGLRSIYHQRYHVTSLFAGMRDGLIETGVPAPTVALAVLLAVVALGFLLHVGALWWLGSRHSDPLADLVVADVVGAPPGIDRIGGAGTEEAAAPSG